MFPAFFGIWLVIVFRSYTNSAKRNPLVVSVARSILQNRKTSMPTVVLTGAGISSSSGIPDYTGTDWLDPTVPTSEYLYSNFISSKRSRELYWASCERFRRLVSRVDPNKAHYALRSLELAGLIGYGHYAECRWTASARRYSQYYRDTWLYQKGAVYNL